MIPLMNNTKWREVFGVLANRKIWFKIEWIKNFEWNAETLHYISPNAVDLEGLKDPGIGGPCYYRNIFQITIPRKRVYIETRDGKYYRENCFFQPIDILLKDLLALGKLPIMELNETIMINGYKMHKK